MLKKIIFVLLLIACSDVIFAEDIETKLKPIIGEYIGEEKPLFGAVIGVIRGDETFIGGFGRVSKDSPEAPNGETVYEIASVSKVFTGVLLAEMAIRNEIDPDDTLAEHLPNGCTVQENVRPMTLKDIAIHRSGLPRLPKKFWEIGKDTPDDPYSKFTVPVLLKTLSETEPLRPPGESYEYSNFGFAVLGTVLALKKEKSYDELVYERISKPLGMESTKMDLDESMQKRLAPGHDVEMNPVKNWYLAGFAGGGGLRSCVNDMMKFAEAALGNSGKLKKDSSLAKAFVFSQTHQGGSDEKPPKTGFAWHIGANETTLHNGQTGGYSSILIIDRKRNIAVIVLSNTSSGKVHELGNGIYGVL